MRTERPEPARPSGDAAASRGAIRAIRAGDLARFAAALLLAGVAALESSVPARAAGDWNDVVIGWMSYEQGLAAAREQNKPICLVFYTTWCPHCVSYSRVFHDPAVVERAKRFVMIRIDKDANHELSRTYSPDGEYIPRTYFLSPAGRLHAEIRAPRERHRYFYTEGDSRFVLAGMEQALAKIDPTPARPAPPPASPEPARARPAATGVTPR